MSGNNLIHIDIAHHKIWLWILALLVTVSSAVYQRLTGPTYPVRGEVELSGDRISYRLLRSETTDQGALISLTVPDTSIKGFVRYKRFKSYDEMTIMALERNGEKLTARLPVQPPAGKILYYVYLTNDRKTVSLTGADPIILRYKGPVPAFVLIPHVLFMFIAMLISNRAALEALDRSGNAKKYIKWFIVLFFLGGFILGPIVQKYAFGEFWTGFPFGYDLTDNKTLIGMLGWLFAWYKNRNDRVSRGSIILASLLLLAVYLIPHSVLGSELDYTSMDSQ